MNMENAGDITKTRIQKLTRSLNPNDRHYAAELLLHTSREEGISYLMELLNDSEPKVRNTAIKTSIKRYNAEVINALIESLGSPAYSNQAMNALVLSGQDTLSALEAAFYRSGQNTQVMLKIVQAMGRIGGARGRDRWRSTCQMRARQRQDQRLDPAAVLDRDGQYRSEQSGDLGL